MPQYPRPFFKRSHNAWYVQLNGRQVRLSEDESAAFATYHELMANRGKPKPQVALSAPAPLLAEVVDKFLDFCRDNRAEST